MMKRIGNRIENCMALLGVGAIVMGFLILVFNTAQASSWKTGARKQKPITSGPIYMIASGGSETTDGDYKIHTFTSDGDFVVTQIGDENTCVVLVVGGGGGGGSGVSTGGGGGGSGGNYYYNTNYTGFSVDTYPATVGAGGAVDGAGSASVINMSLSGDGGNAGSAGSEGAGGAGASIGSYTGGAAWPAPEAYYPAGGGAGNSANGGDASIDTGGAGGSGFACSITGSELYYGGGGGGGSGNGYAGGAGSGGGGAGGYDGTANTGGGGGGAQAGTGGSGGSGIVIIRYKYK